MNDFKARVCQIMLLNTLSITENAFRSSKIKERHGEDEDADDDQGINNQDTAPRRRNKNSARNRALNDLLDSLPKMESHYCRKSTSKLYLEPSWKSKQELFREYCRWGTEKNVSPLSEFVFHNTFTDKNLSLFQPKKDELDVCVAYKTGNCSAEDYEVHIQKKEEARAEKDADKVNLKCVYTMDLQSLLLCFVSNVSSIIIIKESLEFIIYHFIIFKIRR